jgi:serine/threonine protein kinase
MQANILSGKYQILDQTVDAKSRVLTMVLLFEDDSKVELKKVDIGDLSNEDYKSLEHRLKSLSSMSNPYIKKHGESFQDKSILYIVTDACREDSLEETLLLFRSQKIIVSLEVKLRICRQLIHALAYMDFKCVMHGALSPRTIVIDSSERAKISSFPLAINNSKTLLGQREWQYLAPEIGSNSSSTASKKADVYSMGLLLFEILTRKPTSELRINKENALRELREECSGIASIIEKMVVEDPTARITARQAYKAFKEIKNYDCYLASDFPHIDDDLEVALGKRTPIENELKSEKVSDAASYHRA